MKFNKFLKFILLVGDIVLIYFTLLLTLAIRYGDFGFWPGPQTRMFVWHFSFLGAFWILFLFFLDFYEIPPLKKIFDFFSHLIIFLFLAGTTGVIYFYIQPQLAITPKTILFLNILIFGIFLLIWRHFFSRILRLQNFREKIVIIGFQPELKEVLPEKIQESGYEISVFFNSNSFFSKDISSFFSSFSNLAKYGIVSEISKLKEIIEKEKISSIIFTSDFQKNEKMIQQFFSILPFKLNYINFNDFYEELTQKVPIEAINRIWFLENFSRPERKINAVIKRGFDIFFSLIGFLVILILFPFIALAIKIDSPGSVFYTQKRVGKDGKVFTLYKFRTMKADAEKKGPQWAVKNDFRITKFGKFLRVTHLDEFPQFFNILKGDISFVGPRPERPKFVAQLRKEIPFYDIRHLIKPGFTGWAQINYHYGASVEEAKEKLRYDFYYIKNHSLFLDLGIILKTVKIVFR